jgi:hypothetical protein
MNIDDRLQKEYNELINTYGLHKVNCMFTSGFEGFKNSRIIGRYSLDAIKQSLK